MVTIQQTTNERLLKARLKTFLRDNPTYEISATLTNYEYIECDCGCLLEWNNYYNVYSVNTDNCKKHSVFGEN